MDRTKTELSVKIRNASFGTGLWMVAAGASALSLGSSRGAVVLGAPVDLSFDIQPDPGTDLASACVTAKLVAGDTAMAGMPRAMASGMRAARRGSSRPKRAAI